jgi:hypothetical protein
MASGEVVEQDHQVSEQTRSAGGVNDSPATAQSPDPSCDFPRLVQLLARQAACVTDGPAQAIEQRVTRKPVKVVHGETVA